MQLQQFVLRSSYTVALGADAPSQSLPVINKRPQSAVANDVLTRTTARVAAEPSASLPASTPTPTTTSTKSAAATPGELAMQEARASKAFVGELIQMRQKGDKGSLEKFATAMAAKLGMPIADARVVVDAMSRGGTDATALASAIGTLNSMSTADRNVWLSRVIPACTAAARATVAIDDDPTMKTLGAGTDQAQVIADFAYVSSLMTNRNRAANTKPTAEQAASTARDTAYNRIVSSHGPGALQAQARAIDANGKVDENLRNSFAASLAKRLGQSVDSAYALIDAMRGNTQVGRLIADGLDKLERLPDAAARSYAGAFVRTATTAIQAEAKIATNAFESRAGATTDEEVQPIGNLADLNAVFKQLAATAVKAAA